MAPAPLTADDALTLEQVADLLGLSVRPLRTALASGQLHGTFTAGRWSISRAAVDDWVAASRLARRAARWPERADQRAIDRTPHQQRPPG